MAYRVKDWNQFQHFKDRRPPWIKLYRDILDDPEWHELNGEAAKGLVMVWLIASEYDGSLPDLKKLAFRLRITQEKAKSLIERLSHWLEQDDIEVISDRYQDDAPETETETEREKEISSPAGFTEFWNSWPKSDRKQGKSKCLSVWQRKGLEAKSSEIIAHVAAMKQSQSWQDGFAPMPMTYLNQERWDGAEVSTQEEIL